MDIFFDDLRFYMGWLVHNVDYYRDQDARSRDTAILSSILSPNFSKASGQPKNMEIFFRKIMHLVGLV